MKNLKIGMLGWAGLVLVLASCVTPGPPPRLASADEDRQAKQFAPPADAAQLYVHRKVEDTGAKVVFHLLVDGTPAGDLVPDTYLLVTVAPGNHLLRLEAGPASAELPVRALAGKNSFYETAPVLAPRGLVPEFSIVLLEPMGRLMIGQSRRAAP